MATEREQETPATRVLSAPIRPEPVSTSCFPFFALGSCLCIASIPPTICVGFVLNLLTKEKSSSGATGSSTHVVNRQAQYLQSGWKLPWRSARQAQEPSGSRQALTFAEERRLWLQVLSRFFQRRAELQHVGPVVWAFLDDHPRALRIITAEGYKPSRGSPWCQLQTGQRCVLDVPISRSSADVPPMCAFQSGHILGLMPSRVVYAEDRALVLRRLFSPSGRHSERYLRAHTSNVTCYSVLDGELVTGSADTTVRLWTGRRCRRVLASQEWSEWTGTVYLGHIAAVSAVAGISGKIISGDVVGAIAVWQPDGSCQMLSRTPPSAVTCLTPVSVDQSFQEKLFIAGYADGSLWLAESDTKVHATWLGDGPILAAKAMFTELSQEDCPSAVLAASPHGLLQASVGQSTSKLVSSFPYTANAARFERGMVLACCGANGVAVLSEDGHLKAIVNLCPGSGAVGAVAASFIDPIEEEERRLAELKLPRTTPSRDTSPASP